MGIGQLSTTRFSANGTKEMQQTELDSLNKAFKEKCTELIKVEEECKRIKDDFETQRKAIENKNRYLRKSLNIMHENFNKYTPLVEIEHFIVVLKRAQEESRKTQGFSSANIQDLLLKATEKMERDPDFAQNDHKLFRATAHCELLEFELKQTTERMWQLEQSLLENRIDAMTNQHWLTTHILEDVSRDQKEVGIQMDSEVPMIVIKSVTPALQKLPVEQINLSVDTMANNKSLECQLKQAMILASTRSALLLETENRLAEAQGRLKGMEKCLEERSRLIQEERDSRRGQELDQREESVFSIAIASRYQDLLKTERLEYAKSCSEHNMEIDSLMNEREELRKEIKERDILVEELKEQLLEGSGLVKAIIKPISLHNITEKYIENGSQEEGEDDSEIEQIDSNRFIDEAFTDESKIFELAEKQIQIQELEARLEQAEGEIRRLHKQLIEVSNRWENVLAEKDREIEKWKGKSKDGMPKNTNANTTNVYDLKELLDEKDRHINDLTETLAHFHDDQQNFMNDTTIRSAEDVSRLSSELSRSEATNKVMSTQLEAVKRQSRSLEKREKQARDLVKTLKIQLIQRPVISGKTVRKEDQNRRKIELIQAELSATKEELRKQINLTEQRRSKGQKELQLWEKHKKSQQSEEKLRIKLAEREEELAKMKCQLAAARQTVSRLEREKQVTDAKRNGGEGHYCKSPSCPSQVRPTKDSSGRPAADTPETETDHTDDDDKYYGEIAVTTVSKQWQEQNHNEVINALKARIETQQRVIVAMQLGGPNVLMEKFQEQIANLESQNLKLDAKNLKLQLDNDLLRNGNDYERQRKQIRHLEDYILVLKDELSHAIAVASTNIGQPVRTSGQDTGGGGGKPTSNMQQTILALKRIVERLRLENKALKEGKDGVVGGQSSGQQELKHVQDLYLEALKRISKETSKNNHLGGTARDDELKAKLEQKTQLLEKAKVLLTRAASKEKTLREQIESWKQKCSDLPAIEEE